MKKNICCIEAAFVITSTVDMAVYIGKEKMHCDMLGALRMDYFMECENDILLYSDACSGTEMNSEGDKIYFGSFREGKRDGRGEEFENGKLVSDLVD